MEEARARVDPKTYSAFIRQIELRDLWLQSASIENMVGPMMPEPGEVTFEPRQARWASIPNGFHAFQTYSLKMTDSDEETAATMTVTFGVEFSSEQPMTDDLFAVFADVNLPINTWPFLREFFYTTTGRMGWVPLTLPAIKVEPPSEPPSPDAKPRKRSRKSTSAASA